MTVIGAAIGVVVGLFAKLPRNSIPASHQEANQIAFFFELPINSKASFALVFLDVCHNLVGTGSAKPWTQRQIR